MVNYIELLNEKASFSRMQRAICKIYADTGQEDSKLFPLLNYAARVQFLEGFIQRDEIEDMALKCVRDNIPFVLNKDYMDIRNGFATNIIEAHEPTDGNCVTVNNTIIFNREVAPNTRALMYDYSSRIHNPNMPLYVYYPQIVKSLSAMLSKDFHNALAAVHSKIEAFPDERRIMRHIKESAMSKKCEICIRPLSGIIDEHLRTDNSPEIIFTVLMTPYCDFPADSPAYELYVCHYQRESYTCTLFNRRKITIITDMSGIYASEVSGSMNFIKTYTEGVGLLKKVLSGIEKMRNNFI